MQYNMTAGSSIWPRSVLVNLEGYIYSHMGGRVLGAKLSKLELLVQLMTKISSKWQYFCFSAGFYFAFFWCGHIISWHGDFYDLFTHLLHWHGSSHMIALLPGMKSWRIWMKSIGTTIKHKKFQLVYFFGCTVIKNIDQYLTNCWIQAFGIFATKWNVNAILYQYEVIL